MNKKILSVLICLLIAFQVSVCAKTFPDVVGHWSESYVNELTDSGLINGFEDGTFQPDSSVIRADTLLLASRLYGINNQKIAEFTDVAFDTVYENVKECGFPGYEKGLSYLVYNGFYSASELKDFAFGKEGEKPLKRYEAAILFVKIIGAEKEVKENTTPVLEYDDAQEIPDYARAYVEYCAKYGIMNGMGENKFCPMEEVTRGQIAKLLLTVKNKLSVTCLTGTVQSMSDDLKTAYYHTDGGNDVSVSLTDDIILRKNGEALVDNEAIKTGDRILVTCANDEVFSIDFITCVPDGDYTGIYAGYENGPAYTKLKIKASKDDADVSVFKINGDCVVTYGENECGFDDYTENAVVDFTVENGYVTKIVGENMEQIVEGTVEGFTYSNPGALMIKLDDGTVENYIMNPDIEVLRNDVKTTLRGLYIGDKVVATIQYRNVVKLTVTGITKDIEGTIKELVISENNPSVLISADGELTRYNLSGENLKISLNSKDATIYDLKLGYKVKLTLEGKTVTKIEVFESSLNEQVTVVGKVKDIDTSYKCLIVELEDGTEGYIFVDASTVIVDSKTAKTCEYFEIPLNKKIIAIVSKGNLSNTAVSIAILSE